MNYSDLITSVWDRTKKINIHVLEIYRGASIALFLKLLGALLSFLLNIIISRKLGPEGIGIFYLCFSIVTITAAVGRGGLENVMLRMISINSALNNWKEVKGVYKTGIKLVLYFSLISSIILFLIAKELAIKIFSKVELYIPLLVMIFSIIPLALLTIYSEILKGLKQIKRSQLVQGVLPPGLTVIFFTLIGKKFDTLGAVGSYNLAVLITFLTGLFFWIKSTPLLKGIQGKDESKLLLKSGIHLFFIMIINLLIDRISIFFLGIYYESSDVGVFSIAFRTTMLTTFILTSVNSISAPKFAELYSKKDKKNLNITAVKSARVMSISALPILIVFLFFPKFVLNLFGAGFERGFQVLIILAIAQFINVSFGSVGFLLIMTGYEKTLRNISFLGLAICIILNVFLVPSFGISGAAIATAFVILTKNVVAFIYVKKLLNINIFKMNTSKFKE